MSVTEWLHFITGGNSTQLINKHSDSSQNQTATLLCVCKYINICLHKNNNISISPVRQNSLLVKLLALLKKKNGILLPIHYICAKRLSEVSRCLYDYSRKSFEDL